MTMIVRFFIALIALQQAAASSIPHPTPSYAVPDSEGWSEWSACSFSCGGGVREQWRPCTQAKCTKEKEYQYQSCNLQPCASPSDPRQYQCSSIEFLPVEGHLSTLPNTYECTLNCMGYNQRGDEIRLNWKALAGTPCRTGEQDGYCLGEMCLGLKLSCDGILGSAKDFDKCGNCPSCNMSCDRQSGIVKQGDAGTGILKAEGVTISLTISGQATLRALDGLQTVSEGTQSFIIGGAKFTKQANGDLFATGPLMQDITIELLQSAKANQSVEYEYYLSVERQAPDDGNTYVWHYANFTECSTTCGTGLEVSHAYCRDEEFPDKAIPDWFCSVAEKPLPIVRKCSRNACPARWVTGEWGVCSTACGQGQQTRSVSCKQVQSDSSDIEVSSNECAHLPEPSSTQQCMLRQCGKWKKGPWSECSESCCGVGTETREVYCVAIVTEEIIDDSNCELLQQGPKPDSMRPCTKGSCSYEWSSREWSQCSGDCGMQTQTREVYCTNQCSEIVNDTTCEGSKPPTEQPCTYQWCPREWSECSATCGEGMQTRAVECRVFDESVAPRSVSEWHCRKTKRPSDSQSCSNSTCPRPLPPPDCINLPGVNCVASVLAYGCDLLHQICCLTCFHSI